MSSNMNLTWNSNMAFVEATTPATDRGNVEKVFAMLLLGLGSFLSGLLPAIISEQNRRRFPLTTSLSLCFGGGVLLATALVHILPEVRQALNNNLAEISFCAGFLLIYLIDELLHYFVGDHVHPAVITNENTEQQTYGSTVRAETEPLLQSRQSISTRSSNESLITIQPSIPNTNACAGHDKQQTAVTGVLGLFVALTLHSAIEGMAIGVQDSASKVLLLLGAVACHKFVMGFCLGLELCTNLHSKRQHLFGVLVFALGAVMGIGIGMLLVDMPTKLAKSALPILQALAGGTLLYVTACEVLSREKSRRHLNSMHKSAGIAQCVAIIAGFTAMTLINTFVSEED